MIERIVLASTSPYRRAQLEQLGLQFECVKPAVNEEDLKKNLKSSSPRELAEKLAIAKATSLNRSQDLVIGADQVAVLNDEVLGKPGHPEAAVEQLQRLSGQTHQLITSVCVVVGDQQHLHTEVAHLAMRRLEKQMLQEYVNRDQSWDCAGAYKFEKAGLALFEQIDCKDPSAIIGLPLMAVAGILLKFEVPLFLS